MILVDLNVVLDVVQKREPYFAASAAAEASGCDVIVTRNVKDFDKSPVSVVTPEEYLLSSIQ